MKKITTIVTAAVLATAIGGAPCSGDAAYICDSSNGEDRLRATVRHKLCESLTEGVLSGNVSPDEAIARLKAYDRANRLDG